VTQISHDIRTFVLKKCVYPMTSPEEKLQKLKYNTNFSPCEVHDDDEIFRNGIFVFNITKILNDIESNVLNPVLIDLDLKQWKNEHSLSANINEEHLKQCDISKPIIIAEISPQRYNCIDGNHRLYKAYLENVQYIKAYKLSSPHHINYITDISAYKSYIDYWNSKLED